MVSLDKRKKTQPLLVFSRICLAIGLLSTIATIVCALLAIWGGDPRWGDTGILTFLVALLGATLGVITLPLSSDG